MAHIKREQLAAIGIHYVYYPLDYMLDSQAKAGYKTIEMLGMAPHYLMDETGYQDPVELRKKVEARGMNRLLHPGVRHLLLYHERAGRRLS